MVAPTPVSGLLHAVAVVKSGAFGVARVVLDVFGPETVADLGVGVALAALAAFTLLTASVIALRQDNLKRRLAYSTVSQLSYIVLGLGVGAYDGTGLAMVGGLLHIPAHAFMKLTLFFCAGAVHVETHTDDISNMAGIGKRMPLTMAAFGVASLGMAGIPLLAGFVSKYYLLVGTVSGGELVFTAALLVSGILNVAYFWPVVYTAFFESPGESDPKPLIEGVPGGRFGESEVTPGDGPGPDRAVAPDGGSDPDGDDAPDEGSGSEEHAETERDDHGFAPDHEGQGAVDDLETMAQVTPDHGHDERLAWEHRGWTGGESTWFMLGPILAAAAGAVVLGVVPDAAVFLQVVVDVVESVTGVTVP
jgi:NADH:ubiquinone oxidoreductase subunit 5 (subunit L)/multisubunit Na+/H+ antiporter MnhA subunit